MHAHADTHTHTRTRACTDTHKCTHVHTRTHTGTRIPRKVKRNRTMLKLRKGCANKCVRTGSEENDIAQTK